MSEKTCGQCADLADACKKLGGEAMDIDQLLAKHRPPWSECPPDRHAVEYNCTRGDCELEHIAVMAVNAYAALKAERDTLRKCVEAADELRRGVKWDDSIGWYVEPDYQDDQNNYDAARRELP